MLLRDLERFVDAHRPDGCPVSPGRGALAGTTYPLDGRSPPKNSGLCAPAPTAWTANPSQDFCIELTAAMATCMVHLSRLSEDHHPLVQLGSSKFIELDDAFTTGFLHHAPERNPDVHRADPGARPGGSTAT